jgi:acetate---CoA ligase (ADP-forming)
MNDVTSPLAGAQFQSYAGMQRCIQPASIAVVGASEKAGAFGAQAIQNLSHYEGRLHLVNPRRERIGGRVCHPCLAALPEVPDCVVLAVPADATEALVRECAELGVGAVVIFASGFAETKDPANVELQARLTAIAARSGLRIFGPNCLGFVNYLNAAIASFVPFPQQSTPSAHRIGIVSQSGALGLALSQAASRGVSLSHVLTYGNGCDLEAADLIAYLAQDPACRAIACVFEGSKAPRRIVDAAKLAFAHGKPLVLYKMASGAEGARAALSHTGSLAGEDSSYRVTLRAAGAVLVDDFEALVETAAFFAKFSKLTSRGQGAAVISGSGGAGILAADQAELHGVALPQPSPAVQRLLASHIPAFGSARNPCDITAQILSNPKSLELCAVALATDEGVSVLVSPQPGAAAVFLPRMGALESAAEASGKPVCLVLLDESLDGPSAAPCERSPRLAVFRSMSRCFAAVAAWQWRCAKAAEDLAQVEPTDPEARACALGLLRAARSDVLTERESKQLLSAYGIPVVADALASTEQEAVQLAERAGYPVVLKIESPDIPHKSDIGGVRLHLRSAAEVTSAFRDILATVKARVPSARVGGVVVQRMLDRGVEIIVGARNDAEFGPLITVGMGGLFVELLNDVRSAPAPISAPQAIQLLRQLKAARILDGFRGSQPVDLEQLARIISAASRLAADLGSALQELDINPIVCGRDGVHAVDALVVRAAGGGTAMLRSGDGRTK